MKSSEWKDDQKNLEQLLGFNILKVIEESVIATNLKGNIIFWNKGAEKVFGYEQKEAIGEELNFIYPELEQKHFKEDLKRLYEGKAYNGEWKGKKKGGDAVWVKIKTSAFRNKEDKVVGFVAIAQDITEQKHTLKELIESEIKYQTIFENSEEGLLLMKETIIECNKKLCEIWGYTKKEILGKTPGDFSPKFQKDGMVSEEKVDVLFNKALQEGSVTFDWQHLTKKGNILETKISLSRIRIGGVYHLIAEVQDLSKMYKYQEKLKAKSNELLEQNEKVLQLNEELKESNIKLKIINKQIDLSEKKFRVAFKTSPDAININRLNDGTYIEINQGFTQLTGYQESEVIGKSANSINLWEKAKQRDEFIKELIKKRNIVNREIKFIRKDKTSGIGLISASIIDIDGMEHYILITRDISERKEYEEKLKEARQKAEESDMLKSAFLANMSHEIRTPMNAILGFGQLLREKELDREKQNKFLDIIVIRSQNLLQIINDIIDISKIEANQLKLEIKPFSLNRMLYELFSSFEAELATQNKAYIKLDYQAELKKEASVIKSDELRLKQILTNLISNAIKFTDKGKIEFGYKIKKKNLEFFVRDTGLGIPKEFLDKIFKRFRQVDDSSTREYGGTGLGLSICKQLVEMLGGKIWVESEQNKGSVFYFTIPFNVQESLQEKQVILSNPAIDLSNKKIMIVEDDLISMTYLEELLNPTNAILLKAFDGLEAVKKFESEPQIDLILMDIHLPGLSGNEAIKRIKNINKNVPILAQSAYAMPGDKKESFKSGCDDYITKPIDSRLLFSTIKKLLY